MHLVSPGERVVAVNDVYGGTYRLFSTGLRAEGLRRSSSSPPDGVVEPRIDERTRLVWVETPTNPLLNIVDIRAVAEAAHAAGAVVVVDNTFATPYLQRPLELGADIVVHSTTKYLGGHSDLIGGFAATNDPTVAERLAFLQNSLGAVPGPFDSWLVLRGLKTLALRMQRHCENARAVAEFLDGHPKVERVLYPGCPAIPATRSPRARCPASAEWSRSSPRRAEEAIALVAPHEDLEARREPRRRREPDRGPAAMTHASTADAPFAAPPNLVRLSVGIESADDLVADLEAALVRTAATA